MPMDFHKFFRRFMIDIHHFFFIILSTSFQYMFDLGNGDHREKFREQEITGKEQSESTHVKSNLPNSGFIISTPGTGQIIHDIPK